MGKLRTNSSLLERVTRKGMSPLRTKVKMNEPKVISSIGKEKCNGANHNVRLRQQEGHYGLESCAGGCTILCRPKEARANMVTANSGAVRFPVSYKRQMEP